MKRHIIFACIYEYVCTMVMKKFTFLLITLFSSTLILLADNPYRSYTVADGLSNSTVKAIYQDEMGYIWLGTKDGLNRLDGYEIKNFFYESDETVRQSNDIVSITGDRQGRMWIGTFNGITLFDPFEEKYIDLATLYSIRRSSMGGYQNGGIYPSEWKMYLFGSVKRTLYKQYGTQCR